jgi:hypothetical protein
MMIAIFFILSLQAATPDIVVSGRRLSEAYAACAEHGCSPLRDAQASIAFAEQQFRDGAYLKARRTLKAAISRNKRHSATDPKPVSALYEAYATVSLHDGDLDAFKSAVGQQVRTLRDNLPANDPAVVAAAFATGDMWLGMRNGQAAEISYRTIERQALADGNAALALQATLRRVGLASARGDTAGAARLMAEAEARPIAADPKLRAVLQVVQLRLAAGRKDDTQINQLVRAIGHDGPTRPTLIWAPPYESTGIAAAQEEAAKFDLRNPVPARSSDVDPIQWVDIGFWIRPDGKTNEPEILRGSRSTEWAGYLLKQVSERRYTGFSTSGTDRGVYRVERFTLRGTYQIPIGSLMRRRGGAARLEVLDLTQPDTSVPAKGS